MATVLYGDALWESPYVFSTYVALEEKGVPFDVRTIDIDHGEQRRPDYAAHSLTARVPALDHDGFWLSESQAIAEYVDEAFDGPRLFPADLRDRARARQVMGWIRSDLVALREERPTTTIFFAPATAPLGAKAQTAADKLIRVASALVKPGQEFLFGAFTVADADLALLLHRLIASNDPLPASLHAYAEGIWDRPSVRSYVVRDRPPLP